MADSTPSALVPAPLGGNLKTRLILAASGLVILASVIGYGVYAAAGLKQMEGRIIAGDFTNIRLERIEAVVEESGKVQSKQVEEGKELTVASLKLIPPGTYQAVLVANDGNPKHIEKTELVIAGQDAKGNWHPQTAPQVLERLMSPHPGMAQ